MTCCFFVDPFIFASSKLLQWKLLLHLITTVQTNNQPSLSTHLQGMGAEPKGRVKIASMFFCSDCTWLTLVRVRVLDRVRD